MSYSRLQSPHGSLSARMEAYAMDIRDELDFDDDSKLERRRRKRKRRGGAVLFGLLDWEPLRKMWALRFQILALCVLLAVLVLEVRHLSPDRAPSTSPFDGKGEKAGTKIEESVGEHQDANGGEDHEEEQPLNLNKMDMPMRKTKNGTEPCLPLLSSEDIDKLELPEASDSPVRILKYVRKKSKDVERKVHQPLSSGFAGYQTMEERKISYELRDTVKVHCGFCEEGDHHFKIESLDSAFMNQCTVVVVTCAFGGGDDLYQPIGMSQTTLSRVCYVALWDEVTLEAQASHGKVPDPVSRKIGLWRIVVVRNLPFSDQRLNGKIPKMLSHRLFPQARYSIWVDSKSQFRRDPIGVLEAVLWQGKSVFAISLHGARSCVYKEGQAIVRKHKALPDEVSNQLDQYRSEGLREQALFHGHKALAEASVIIREHTPLTNLFMCLWFNEVVRYTSRDQLSFPYVLLRLQAMKPNMFRVCTRRALVNSIGHKSKPKRLDVGR